MFFKELIYTLFEFIFLYKYFDKNYTYLEELITHYIIFLAYFNKFYEKICQKKLIRITKTGHFNDKNTLLKIIKNIGNNFPKNYVKNR